MKGGGCLKNEKSMPAKSPTEGGITHHLHSELVMSLNGAWEVRDAALAEFTPSIVSALPIAAVEPVLLTLIYK